MYASSSGISKAHQKLREDIKSILTKDFEQKRLSYEKRLDEFSRNICAGLTRILDEEVQRLDGIVRKKKIEFCEKIHIRDSDNLDLNQKNN